MCPCCFQQWPVDQLRITIFQIQAAACPRKQRTRQYSFPAPEWCLVSHHVLHRTQTGAFGRSHFAVVYAFLWACTDMAAENRLGMKRGPSALWVMDNQPSLEVLYGCYTVCSTEPGCLLHSWGLLGCWADTRTQPPTQKPVYRQGRFLGKLALDPRGRSAPLN